jgi:hypothetical protein
MCNATTVIDQDFARARRYGGREDARQPTLPDRQTGRANPIDGLYAGAVTETQSSARITNSRAADKQYEILIAGACQPDWHPSSRLGTFMAGVKLAGMRLGLYETKEFEQE